MEVIWETINIIHQFVNALHTPGQQVVGALVVLLYHTHV